jgi:hypothetical protein
MESCGAVIGFSLIALALIYDQFADVPEVRYGTIASVAAAAGLSFGVALKASFRVLRTLPAILLAVGSPSAVHPTCRSTAASTRGSARTPVTLTGATNRLRKVAVSCGTNR